MPKSRYIIRNNLPLPSIALDEDRPFPFHCARGLESFERFNLSQVIDKNTDDRPVRRECFPQSGEVCDLVDGHGQSIEELEVEGQISIDNSLRTPSSYIFDDTIRDQTGVHNLPRLH